LITLDADLQQLFSQVGERHGYDEVEARFSPYKEFKSTWMKSDRRAKFCVSDYLMGADEGIVEDFAHYLFCRMGRKIGGGMYTDRLRAWLSSPQFIARNQPLYLRRSRNLSLSARGKEYDLTGAYWALRDQGLISDSSDAILSWTVQGNRQRVGYCNVLMRVIAVSSALDNELVPEFVHQYVLYHELLHLDKGLQSEGKHHGTDFRRMERNFPQWKESERWLKKIASNRSAPSGLLH